jgi:hypothetical protein
LRGLAPALLAEANAGQLSKWSAGGRALAGEGYEHAIRGAGTAGRDLVEGLFQSAIAGCGNHRRLARLVRRFSGNRSRDRVPGRHEQRPESRRLPAANQFGDTDWTCRAPGWIVDEDLCFVGPDRHHVVIACRTIRDQQNDRMTRGDLGPNCLD